MYYEFKIVDKSLFRVEIIRLEEKLENLKNYKKIKWKIVEIIWELI